MKSRNEIEPGYFHGILKMQNPFFPFCSVEDDEPEEDTQAREANIRRR